MSVLSNVDIKKEIKKGNIRIFPLNTDNLKGSTYNLTASKYAWSLNDNKSLVDGDKITVPSNDSAIIATKEVIWVSTKICGSYHSKVALVSEGGGHIGTTLDPEWIGHSLITIHNHSKKPLVIGVNKSIVSIMFQYLNKKTTAEQDNNSSQLDYLYQFVPSVKDDNEAVEYFNESWKRQPKNLEKKMKNSEEYSLINTKDKTKVNWILSIFYFVVIVLLVLSIFGISTFEQDSIAYNLTYFFSFVGFSGIVGTVIIAIHNKIK
ncbi:dCTP deaminase domain-containing protein [Planococcus sp. 4-30]|uniref:dCTP deaminase domain-containing protein n=1 Tax=Planococcus sp. 4-30 TaxID=2874583 RepID=UPI001CBB3276|nr:hypothetical protein [Planococcus sp. 4-30]